MCSDTTKFGLASVAKMGGACGRSGQSKNGAVFGRGTSLSLSLSRCSHFLTRLWVKFKGLFSYFIVVLTHLFAYKRHFLGYFVFLKFLNALFVRLCALFVILSLLQKGEKSTKIKENLPFLDTSLTLSMTNSGFCLKIMDIFTQILKQRFKFFTQNSKHCIKSTHFITLSQILSLTQGFFIFLPQIFAQFLLINSTQRSSYGRQGTKAPF